MPEEVNGSNEKEDWREVDDSVPVFKGTLAQNGSVSIGRPVREEIGADQHDVVFAIPVKVISPRGNLKYMRPSGDLTEEMKEVIEKLLDVVSDVCEPGLDWRDSFGEGELKLLERIAGTELVGTTTEG